MLHQSCVHGEHEVFGLQVQHGTGFQQVLLQVLPVGVGHPACGIPVAVELSALDVYLDVGIVGQIFLGVVELVEDVKHHLVCGAVDVQALSQIHRRAGLVVARNSVRRYSFQLQSAAGLRRAIHIQVNDVARVGHDASRAGELAERVAHDEVVGVHHLLVMAVDLVVGDAEETLVVGGVAAVGVLLPGVVLHFQHHSLRIQRGVMLVCCQSLVREGCNVSLECRAGLVLEEVVQMGLELSFVGNQVVVGVDFSAGGVDDLLRELCFLEAPFACSGIRAPQHHVVALTAGIVEALAVAWGGYGPFEVPFVAGALDVEVHVEAELLHVRGRSGVERGAGLCLRQNVTLCQHVLYAPVVAALGQRPVLRDVAGIHILGAHVTAGSLGVLQGAAVVGDYAVVLALAQLAYVARHVGKVLAHLVLGDIRHSLERPHRPLVVVAIPLGYLSSVIAQIKASLAREVATRRDVVIGVRVLVLLDVQRGLAAGGRCEVSL